ncbi:hypothetical protein [Frigidibacter oleivorans]|uniref:hypothetical protein n=1 Tax=Frigidibacter oleivorans TaxID=2487129 RepID=UPI000F8E7576|nr:hypothetical protein [Frigidibacter oleivorans]
MAQSPHLALIAALVFTAPTVAPAPVMAQTVEPEPPAEEGFDLFRDGAESMLRGLIDEMGPALDGMEQGLRELGPELRAMAPMIRELATIVGDARDYHAPEEQPNGDILIRRKTPAEREAEGLPPYPAEPLDPPGPGEIDL